MIRVTPYGYHLMGLILGIMVIWTFGRTPTPQPPRAPRPPTPTHAPGIARFRSAMVLQMSVNSYQTGSSPAAGPMLGPAPA